MSGALGGHYSFATMAMDEVAFSGRTVPHASASGLDRGPCRRSMVVAAHAFRRAFRSPS